MLQKHRIRAAHRRCMRDWGLLGMWAMDGNGLEAVLLANRAALERFLCARCGNAAEAEDLIQELWLKLAGATGPVVEPLAYLYRMADNLVLDKRRSAQRRERRDDAWQGLVGGGLGGALDAPSAEQSLIGRDQLRHVEQELAALGTRTANILKRYRVDGIGQRDIAAEHGISISAVEKHLQKAYRALLEIRAGLDADKSEA